ncbi:uncharacterized protein LOC128725030 [Anopheles nili]|uniref:uncharacterized protein LOC128725030 n=1 Tax=Anopheles nili TaxID=185578 RepID=UPI00237AB6F7|nr:uncharacterized protein LOC128725030 [Anopheles nili]
METRRTLRSSNRLSLSLSARKHKTSVCKPNEDSNHSVAPECVSILDTIPYLLPAVYDDTSTASSSIGKAGHMSSENDYSISNNTELQKLESVVIISDEENDVQSPTNTSIPEFSSSYNTDNGNIILFSNTDNGTTSAVKAIKTSNKATSKLRRKICPNSNIKMLTKKHFDDSQKRITNFFNKEANSDRIGYCRVLKKSVMPAIITGDIEIESMLSVTVEEGTEKLSIRHDNEQFSVTAGDLQMCSNKIMENIEKAQSACYDPIRDNWNMERVLVPIEVPLTVQNVSLDNSVNSSNSINSLKADLSRNAGVEISERCNHIRLSEVDKTPKNTSSVASQTDAFSQKKQIGRKKMKKKVVCPPFKIIAGTNFAVDAFRYGEIEGVTHYFLTHFHADHYIGLKKTFSYPLIMSPITARLVKSFINVSEEHFRLIELHQSIFIDGVEIIALDANHCPGGIMFLFRLPDGTNMLHTGDFRASPDMEEFPEFWNFQIDCIYLDTTYLSSKYAFKPQWESVADAKEIVSEFLKKRIGTKVLIVCGSYLIGKEKVWLELAITTGMKVWTESNRLKALKAISDPQQLSLLVANPVEANIHVLAMNKLTYDELNEYLNQFPDQYESIIALRPSGWEKNSKPQYRGRINIVGIEYSEHSNFDELKRFVQFLRPSDVISTVPYGNSNQNRTPTVPVTWYQGPIKPQRKSLQMSITNFMATPKILTTSKKKTNAIVVSKSIKSEIIDLDSSEEEITTR